MILIDGDKVFIQMVELGSFVFGWALRGLVTATFAEILFRPIARRIKKRVTNLERTNPLRYAVLMHAWHQHPGEYIFCDLCNPST